MALGAGRARVEDTIDPAVGLVLHKKVGQRVALKEPLATLYFNDDRTLTEAQARLEGAFTLGSAPPPPASLVLDTLA